MKLAVCMVEVGEKCTENRNGSRRLETPLARVRDEGRQRSSDKSFLKATEKESIKRRVQQKRYSIYDA